MPCTPQQARILQYLASRSPAWVNGYELRDAISPGAGVKAMHVQVRKLRIGGAQVESLRGSRGGYRLPAA
jgi:hypothetical protein